MPAGASLSCPPALSVIPPGLFVMPAGLSLSYRRPPLSFPPAPLCHSRRLLAGIQHLALLFFFLCGPAWRKDLDSRLKMSGMTEEGLNNVGHDGRPARPLCHARRGLSVIPAGFPLSCPPVSPITNVGDKVSGNPASCFVVLSFVWPCMGKTMDSRLKTSGMTEGGLPTSGMTEEDYQPLIETVEGRLWE